MEMHEILTEGDAGVLIQLADTIAARHQIKVLQAPETCLVMLQARDSVEESAFYLGEVLITEAVVEIKGVRGYGLVMEDEPAKALCLAVINAALAAGLPDEAEIREIFDEQKRRAILARKRKDGLVAATRVRFAVMEG